MAKRTYGYAKTITSTLATETFQWNPGDFPSAGLVKIGFKFSTVGAVAPFLDFSKVDALQVVCDTKQIVHLTRQQIRARSLALSQSKYFIAEGAKEFVFPFSLVDEENQDLADLVQVPLGSQVEVKLFCSAVPVGSKCTMAFCNSTQRPAFYPELVRRPMNIGPSAVNHPYMVPASRGELRGFALNSSRVKQLALYMERQNVLQLPGSTFDGLNNEGDLLAAMFTDDIGPLMAATPFFPSLTPLWVPFKSDIPMLEGRTYFQMDTAATWTQQDEIVLDILHKQSDWS